MIRFAGGDWFGLSAFEPGEGRRTGFLYLLDEVGSTSDFLLGRGGPARGRLCRWDGWGWQAGQRTGITPPSEPRERSVAVARRQSSGRGRQGRRWYGGDGLLFSWVIAPVPRDRAPRLAVWAGLMAAEAVAAATGREVALKWPNDLQIDGRKLGGMILDLVQRGPRRLLVAGLGLNLGPWPADVPADVRAVGTTLASDLRPAELAGEILARCDAELPGFLESGWPGFRARLDARDALRGRTVRLVGPDGPTEATAAGIDDDGALILVDEAGRRRSVLAGDVHLLRPGEEPR